MEDQGNYKHIKSRLSDSEYGQHVVPRTAADHYNNITYKLSITLEAMISNFLPRAREQ